jgi:integrase
VRLRDLGPPRVREWRAEIIDAGCPPTQANHALSVLSAALGAAAADGRIPANPCLGIRKLTVAIARPRALAPLEVERLRAEMPSLRDVVLVGLLAYAGLRPGEALALTWASVGAVLVVDRAVSAGEVRQTKTNSRRTVEVIPPLAEDLALLRPRRALPGDLVCAGVRGNVLNLRNWTRRVWRPACERAGVMATPYDGRHTYASLLIHEGRALPYVTAALGHASSRTTLDHYAHLFDSARLATGVPMIEAIIAARAELRAAGVYPMCTERPARWIRGTSRTGKK